MIEKRINLPDLRATEALALRLAPHIRAEDAILLSGPLGIGKTSFARMLLRSLCRDPEMEVPSPSFTLVQIYDAPAFPVYHYDLWRLESEEDLIELDWDEAREGVVLVEWPERLNRFLPENALHISLSLHSESIRQAVLSGWDDRLDLIK